MKGKFLVKAGVGAAAGLISGLFGGGGGMVVVPLLIFALKFNVKRAHATAIAVVLPITVVAAITYFIGTPYDILTGVTIAVGVTVGGVIGAFLLKLSPPKCVTMIFAFIMLAAGIKLLAF